MADQEILAMVYTSEYLSFSAVECRINWMGRLRREADDLGTNICLLLISHTLWWWLKGHTSHFFLASMNSTEDVYMFTFYQEDVNRITTDFIRIFEDLVLLDIPRAVRTSLRSPNNCELVFKRLLRVCEFFLGFFRHDRWKEY